MSYCSIDVDMISSEDRGFFAYFDDSSLSSCRQSLEDLEHYVKISGPFDGLMAFSMGAVLGATLLVRQAQNGAEVPFRLAIFFCGGVPGDPTALDQNAFRLLDSTTDGEIIGLPTAHIWAHNDPSTLSSPELAKLCIAQLKTTFIHECGHNIPSWNDKNALDKTVQCIQKTIDRAMTFH